MLFFFEGAGETGDFFFNHSKKAKQNGKHLEPKSGNKENEKIKLRLTN